MGVFICLAWFVFISGNINSEKKYTENVTAADKFMEMNLYQKAIESYSDALKVKESFEVRMKLIDAYLQSYTDGTTTKSEYKKALESACVVYPESEELWDSLINMQMDSLNYKGAYSTIKKAINAGVSGEIFDSLKKEVVFSYTTSRKAYADFRTSPQGGCTVFDGANWGDNKNQGELDDCEYEYISPLNSDNLAIYRNSIDTRLIDGDGVVQAYITTEFSEARAYGDGFVPVKTEKGWAYLNCTEDEITSTDYEDASSFADGVAAVKQSGEWMLVDTSFTPINEKRFSDIKLYSNGAFSYKGIMVASEGEEYYLFNTKGERVNEIPHANLDLYYGSYVAFKDDSGIWGYMDKKGNEVIAPQYQMAKSFSNGYAAVYDGENWGFINQSEEQIIDYTFLYADYFTKDGSCIVETSEDCYRQIQLRFPDGA
jgi:hypothetical protein